MNRLPSCLPLSQYKRMQVLISNCVRRWKTTYRFAKPDAPNKDYLQNQNQELGGLNGLLTRRCGFVEKEYLRNHNKATDPEAYYEQRGWRVFYIGDDLKAVQNPSIKVVPANAPNAPEESSE